MYGIAGKLWCDMRNIIYMNNAATSWPKPPCVAEAMANAVNAAPGAMNRGGIETFNVFEQVRLNLAPLLGVSSPEQIALGSNATSVVLAHNHPSGVALPSADDIQTTKRLAIALSAVDITLVDHLVISDGDYVSMVQSGYYRPEDCYCIV